MLDLGEKKKSRMDIMMERKKVIFKKIMPDQLAFNEIEKIEKEIISD